MSLVVFPFKSEAGSLIAANLTTAVTNDRVSEVWAVAADEGDLLQAVEQLAGPLSADHGKPVRVFAQERIGQLRAGKGDGMNTALQRAHVAGFERVHFYDADITNFDHTWIEGAESRADLGHDVVRHRFPRAATDAMITWMITRPSLAMLFPATALPRIGQPLGGELLVDRRIVAGLVADPLVTSRSDWGIDTMLTYATTVRATSLYEHHVASGKRHALYGGLDELRDMVVECLDAVASLSGMPSPDTVLGSDPPVAVPTDLKRVVGYDRDRTVGLLGSGWSDEEVALAERIPGIASEVLVNRDRPNFEFMGAEGWGVTLRYLLDNFQLGHAVWESLAFRLWLIRVLAYTTAHASRGYDHAIDYLEGTVRAYERSD